MPDLKLCPFCGGEAEVGDGFGHRWIVGCTECGASAEEGFVLPDIIKAWNRRIKE